MVSPAVDQIPFVGPDGRLPLPWLAGALQQGLGQPGHALLLVAPPGVGALALQLVMAQSWLCEADDDQPGATRGPCGQCTACRLCRAGTHPDLKLLLPETLRVSLGWAEAGTDPEGGKRKPSRTLKIDEVRAAIDWIVKTTSRGRAKVLVLHPAEALNAAAANALLKTLEEPAAGVRLLLSCSDPEHLLPTVRSRCQRIGLPTPPAADAEAWLRGQGVDAPATLLAAAGGRPLDALALQQDRVDGAAWSALPMALARGQVAVWAGWPLARSIDAMQKLCHDLLAVSVGAEPRYFPATALPAAAGRTAGLLAWANELNRVARHVQHPWQEALLVDAMATRGREALATLHR
jgi:DNA polymerase-3 subunit delta'